MAESKWLESERLGGSEIKALCERASDVRTLAHMQMMASGDRRWLRLARQELIVESFVMGAPLRDPGRCYLVARAGRADDTERQAFEVRAFAVNGESTTVFVIGRAFKLPKKSGESGR
ncbi:hypothetical protein K9U39_18145 [Rhodoblastus acidophilus]|uniref:Uncharacterized protein n=1 Tax=Candidatus Rhodoblastus alkanivorans TaxID=2954117 RepID=A0ABS9Z3M6_9HYPH|nr:hypothetical protein [Candidatus Rhodoblastus alkanivorans]MCI4677423.1 hypothetical protein [Candidatus Rhodoblastus alkanivorans]MCI4681782.1 hypothetical protein [Candidatus Rhodoblastus alkanivorans]MDI4642831.1 hypothetical protein [Rhodoblastus acidophilus]